MNASHIHTYTFILTYESNHLNLYVSLYNILQLLFIGILVHLLFDYMARATFIVSLIDWWTFLWLRSICDTLHRYMAIKAEPPEGKIIGICAFVTSVEVFKVGLFWMHQKQYIFQLIYQLMKVCFFQPALKSMLSILLLLSRGAWQMTSRCNYHVMEEVNVFLYILGSFSFIS